MSSFMHVHMVALRYFRETVRSGSMRQAAAALRVAPSAINRQILKLEDQLQCRLFERLAEGVRLTAAGEVLYHYAQRLEFDLDRALSEIDDLRGLRRGRVSVTGEDGVVHDFLPRVLARFHAEFPRVTYAVEVAAGPDTVAAVVEGRTDIGFALHPPRHADLAILAEAAVPLGVVMPPGHPLAARPFLRLSDLANERLIQLKDGVGAHPQLHDAMRRRAPPGQVVETNVPGAVPGLVRAGLGLAVRSPVGILRDIASGAVAFVPLRDPRVKPGRLALCCKQERALPVASAMLVERLKQALVAFEGEMAAAAAGPAQAARRPVPA